jgi:MYXO-CTERM domain-containing protein
MKGGICMKKKLMMIFFAITFVVTVLSVPVLANMDSDGQNENNRNELNEGNRIQSNNDADRLRTTAAGDDDSDWEWIGLAGLLGLLGLKRRNEREA